ncbi:MAG TPA: three-Cys-motif partner protein TcmP, partial [Candidatus Binatia bacterium]
MAEPQFGGPWTEEKLSRLRKYLQAYMSIFSRNRRAKLLKTIYVDAFAGTGFRRENSGMPKEENALFDVSSDSDAQALRKGSAQVALETNPSFSEYIFIEDDKEHAKGLSTLRRRFPSIAARIRIIPGDANRYLLAWCEETDWTKTRAVVFLDP